jgi:hypothetical protein
MCWKINTHKYKILWKSVQWFSSCYMLMDRETDRHRQTDRHSTANRHILANSCCKQARITYYLPSISSLKIQNTILPSDMQTLIYQLQPLTDILVVTPTVVLLTYRYSHTDCCITDKNCILYNGISQLGIYKFSIFHPHVFSFRFFLSIVSLLSLLGKHCCCKNV